MSYLVATDGSTESDEAVRYAARQAVAFYETLEIAHVLTPDSELVDGTIVLPGEEAAVEAGQGVLESARSIAEEAADEPITVETQLLTGRPADAITEYAAEEPVDAIYVGHRGLSEEREQVVGSVAKSIVDKADVPVTVIR
ncbi:MULTISPECIES: universal stress protein [Halorubrum]|uniref:Universal stress protein n=2 Tax=Halorubrum TaxID=56688 RepID=A0A7D3XWA9_9EURY|nr:MULTISPECIES: universal stress protein [Halorubrum]TKX87574.1 universal stress protein [Halorubrum sp. SS5]KOX95613.1 universal stress protein UspA [Halorubrum tropicale]QKG93604.1 universal stress protein [Halorubrum salinarum]TKX45110.1 universal stress protein [Halorubrum sp. ARQ200]TKX49409.1 universal stress protein [Halorubrum sp. ASP121]